jgi:hypothetical protein
MSSISTNYRRFDWVDVVNALSADPAKTATLAQSISDWPLSSVKYFAGVQGRVKAFVERGQLGIFANAYWGHPAYKLPPEANLMAVAHYLEALDWQRRFIKIHAILGGKNPHLQSFLVGGMATPVDADSQSALNMDTIAALHKLIASQELAVPGRGLEPRLRAGFESLDMATQGRGRRDAEDVIEAVDPTPVEDFGAAIMAVGAQQDLGVGPMGSDRAQQPAQEGLDLLAARPFGGTKHGGDEAALAVEHHDGLKAVFVLMRVEQPQLLAAMDRVERVVDVERDPFGTLGERLAIEIDHRAAHSQQRANVRQVLQPRDRRLRAEFAIRRRQIERHLEHRIAAQGIGVDSVLVAGADHQQPKPDDIRQAVGDLIGHPRINQACGQPIRDPKPLFDFAQRQHAAI